MNYDRHNPLVRRMMLALGCVCVLLGVIGLVMPMMPGAVFLFFAAWCFSRSSERFHTWLLEHKHFGPIVRAFETGEGFTRALRRRILMIMWGSMFISMAIAAKPLAIAGIAVCGLGVTYYLFRQPVYQ